MERDTREVEALLAALNRSAERVQTLWFSFMGLTLYFMITALTTTHRMLLLEDPMSLPIINLKIPLLPFYTIAPLFYLVIHFYMLMSLVLLARTTEPYEQLLKAAFPIRADRERFRARTENALFLQLLVGPSEERQGWNGRLLGAVALITIAVAPVVTLLLMQMMFLPYHHLAITWLHRGAVAVDLVLVFLLWGAYRRRYGRLFPLGRVVDGGTDQSLRPVRWMVGIACVIFAIWLSAWEGRWAGEPFVGRADLEETANGIAFGVFHDRLKLAKETIVGQALLDERQKEAFTRGAGQFVPTRDFSGREFTAAVFSEADLRGVDFSGATLSRGQFAKALMQSARLERARLQGAHLSLARMQGADLIVAHLQGANLLETQLQGADLTEADMQGTDLTLAWLQGADLSSAHMQGADLWSARMQGADLKGAQMQGANLSSALMQGANLEAALIQGADFGGAQLQGANFTFAQMQGALLDGAHVYRATLDRTGSVYAVFDGLRTDRTQRLRRLSVVPEAFDDSAIEMWRAEAIAHVSAEGRREAIAARFDRLTEGAMSLAQDAELARPWRELEEDSRRDDPDRAKHNAARAKILGYFACEGGSGSPYVAQRMIAQSGVSGDRLETFRNRLREGRINPEKCPGVIGFTEDDWRALDNVQAEPSPDRQAQ